MRVPSSDPWNNAMVQRACAQLRQTVTQRWLEFVPHTPVPSEGPYYHFPGEAYDSQGMKVPWSPLCKS
eukprot:2416982-Amphidinium_carterae.1